MADYYLEFFIQKEGFFLLCFALWQIFAHGSYTSATWGSTKISNKLYYGNSASDRGAQIPHGAGNDINW